MDFGIGLLGLAGTAITAGATVGTAFIAADANQSVARTNASAALQVALSNERQALAEVQAQQAVAQIQASSQNVATNAAATTAKTGISTLGYVAAGLLLVALLKR